MGFESTSLWSYYLRVEVRVFHDFVKDHLVQGAYNQGCSKYNSSHERVPYMLQLLTQSVALAGTMANFDIFCPKILVYQPQ